MKYYIYIGDSKVDMLLPQITEPQKRKFATKWGVDLKLFNVSGGPETEPIDNRIRRLELVVDHVRSHMGVGSIDEPQDYFDGTLAVRWGPFRVPDWEVVYFGARAGKTILGLGGSSHQVLGNEGSIQQPGGHHALFLVRYLLEELGDEAQDYMRDVPKPDAELVVRLVRETSMRMRGPEQRVEFLAKRLAYKQRSFYNPKGMNVLLGTPLYVALNE